MFLFEDSRVGVFADLLQRRLFFSAGLEVETTISLLGITELGVLLYGGLTGRASIRSGAYISLSLLASMYARSSAVSSKFGPSSGLAYFRLPSLREP